MGIKKDYYGVSDKYTWEKKFEVEQKGFSVVMERTMEVYKDNYLAWLPNNKDAKILDIGCGWGYFLYFLNTMGYKNIEGVEIGVPQVEMAKKYAVSCVHHIESLEDYLKAKQNYYDVITLNQVVEHFKKEKTIENLNLIRSALKEKGRLIIVTPNMCFFSSAVTRYISFTHEIGFTEWSLRHVLEFAGFSKITILPDTIKWRLRLKHVVWLALKAIWSKILNFIYFIELGETDRPKIISKNLFAIAEK